jgi:hypothetical protein
VLRPKAMSGLEGHRLPTAARWDSVQKRLDSSTIRGELDAPRSFGWMRWFLSMAGSLEMKLKRVKNCSPLHGVSMHMNLLVCTAQQCIIHIVLRGN